MSARKVDCPQFSRRMTRSPANCRGLVLFCRGPTADRYPLAAWTKGFAADEVLAFDLEFTGSALFPKNQLAVSGSPDDDILAAAKRILLVDFPLYYEVLPEKVQNGILAAVKDGAELVVTGGPFGLEKCGNFDSPIAKALPVKLESPWRAPEGDRIVKSGYGKGRIMTVGFEPR